MVKKGVYTHSSIQDYPSVSQINHKVSRGSIYTHSSIQDYPSVSQINHKVSVDP